MNQIVKKYIDNFDGTSCNFSYLNQNIISASFSENFGIVGRGKIIMFKNDIKQLIPINEWYFDRGINCISNNYMNDNILYAGDNDGKLITINKGFNISDKGQIFQNKIHQYEITSLNVGRINKNILLSSSLDNTSNLIDINGNKIISTIQNYFKKGITSNSIDYKSPNIISLSSNDGYVLIFDIRDILKPIKCFSFNNPVMSIDFGFFNSSFAIGESNGIINLYDLRKSDNNPLIILNGHKLSVKEIKFSPYKENILCSCGYDMDINLWNINYSIPIKTFNHHSEFVTGIDFSPFYQNIISSISFDKSLDILTI